MKSNKEKILEQYEKDMDELSNKVMTVIIRAQRKMDDHKYKEILDRLE
jgi:hypothetical protein